ncbi:MAG: hypothetical protein MI757_12160 [Pirellulales bacterium]|nr:hypothetical protein [Pirellulales bacterium]
MIRMIASELAGTKLAPKEVLAIERGELDATRPRQVDPQQQPPQNQVSAAVDPRSSREDDGRVNRAGLIVLGLVVVGVFLFDAAAGKVRRG